MLSNLVHIIDDDDSLRNAIALTLQEAGYNVKSWASAQGFLEAPYLLDNSVVVLDLQMPNLNGLGLISHLNHVDINIQVVFISGAAAPSEIIAAFHHGACDFLLKPFETEMLIAAVDKALQRVNQRVFQKKDADLLMGKFNTLTAKEKIVFVQIVNGGKIKEIATQLDLAEITVKVYKAKIMHKLGFESFAELMKFSQLLNLQSLSSNNLSNQSANQSV